MSKLLLKTEEVADLLQVSKQTLANWRMNKTGPDYIKVSGTCIRYQPKAIDEWLAKQTRSEEDEAE